MKKWLMVAIVAVTPGCAVVDTLAEVIAEGLVDLAVDTGPMDAGLSRGRMAARPMGAVSLDGTPSAVVVGR